MVHIVMLRRPALTFPAGFGVREAQNGDAGTARHGRFLRWPFFNDAILSGLHAMTIAPWICLQRPVFSGLEHRDAALLRRPVGAVSRVAL